MGRPNVGKSALFNRLTGSGLAIVYDYPGVTRDRLYTRAAWGDREFVVVDTGGLMSEAAKLPSDQQPEAMRSISAAGIPQVSALRRPSGIPSNMAIAVPGKQCCCHVSQVALGSCLPDQR